MKIINIAKATHKSLYTNFRPHYGQSYKLDDMKLKINQTFHKKKIVWVLISTINSYKKIINEISIIEI